MKQRAFGATQVSEIGLGAWQLGADWGDVPEDDALDVLRAAVEHGVSFIDTADVYGAGRSEAIIGSFLKSCGERPFIATKLGRFPEPGGEANYSKSQFLKFTEASLKRLGVESIGLSQLHCIPTERMRQGDVFDWLRDIKAQGKIQHFGASVESMDEALLCLRQEGLSSLQIIFNPFRQKPIHALFEKARKQDVALIIRLPLASGLLAGKYNAGTTFPENDHRHYNRDGQMFNVGETFAGLAFEQGINAVEMLRPLVPQGMTLAQMALRWISDHDAVTTIIPGARNRGQAASNCSASDLPSLSAELHKNIQAIYEHDVAPFIRGPY